MNKSDKSNKSNNRYKCSCGMKFTNKQNLYRHQRGSCSIGKNSKTNKKSYNKYHKCPNKNCDKKYSRLDNLKCHMKSCPFASRKQVNTGNNTNSVNGKQNKINNTNVNGNMKSHNSIHNNQTYNIDKINLFVLGKDWIESMSENELKTTLVNFNEIVKNIQKILVSRKTNKYNHKDIRGDYNGDGNDVNDDDGNNSSETDDVSSDPITDEVLSDLIFTDI